MAAVERLKSHPQVRREIPDAGLPGLYLLHHPSGRKGWAFRYRFGGRTRKMVLGQYPALDVPTARSRAREAIQILALGRDPGAEKIERIKAARLAGPVCDHVASAIDDFLERHVHKHSRPRTAYLSERILRKEIVPLWGEKRVQEITRHHVLALLDGIVDRGAPVAANRAFAVVRLFFNWCVDRSIIEVSPCVTLKAPSKETPRDRVLTDEELRLVWLASDRIGWPYGPFVRMLILTAQRLDEVAGLRKAEIREAGSEWHLPANRAKNDNATIVPLSLIAQDILSELPRIPGEFVFTTTGQKPITSFSWAKRRFDAEIKSIAGAAIPHWTFHDLRRTAASGMARLGTDPHVVDATLNHKSGTIRGVAAVYNRHKYITEKKTALQSWSTHVTSLEGSTNG